MMSHEAFRDGALLSLGYVFIFYGLMIGQARAKWKALAKCKKDGTRFQRYYNSQDAELLRWDVSVRNMLEQSVAFLVLFWLCLVVHGRKEEEEGSLSSDFVVSVSSWISRSYSHVIVLGWLYLCFRVAYPFVWGAGGGSEIGPKYKIMIVTIPMYVINLCFSASLLYGLFA